MVTFVTLGIVAWLIMFAIMTVAFMQWLATQIYYYIIDHWG